jgi:fumarylpyruvate hydrolase
MEMPPFNTFLGTQIALRKEGEVEATLVLGPHHLNRRGVVHGGVISALLDTALGGAVISAMPKEWWCATISLNVQFLEGVGEGRVTAVGRLRRRGQRVAFAEGEVLDDEGRVLATATGSWNLWTRNPGVKPRSLAGPWVRDQNGERLRVGKILAIGRNYAAHVEEMNAPKGGPPVVFLKPSSAIVHDGSTVTLPAGAGEVHHEVELVAVIGESGRAIPVERALDHVHGYAVGLDLTLRDVQGRAKQRGEPWSLAKGFDGSAPVSEVVPRDDVGDGSGLDIRLEIDGETRQQGNTSLMLRSVAELVSYASTWITLDRGDLLYTGTPSGVGPILPGQRLHASIEKVGTLDVTVDGATE